jgi:hypothetical protein
MVTATIRASFCVLTLVPTAAGSATAADVLVERHQLQCVIENADKYARTPSDPVLIILSICPETEFSVTDAAEMAINDLPSLEVQVQGGTVQKVLALTKRELACLKERGSALFLDMFLFNGKDIVRLPSPFC